MKFAPLIFAFCLFPVCSWSAQSGDPAPECSLPLLTDDSQTVSLNQFKGKVILLDFWASWCPPCEKSFPFLDQLQEKFKSKGLEVITVNLDEEKQDALTFIKSRPVTFTIVHDSEGICPELYQVQAMPSSYLIDKSGKIKYVNYGFLTSEEEALTNQVTSLLNE